MSFQGKKSIPRITVSPAPTPLSPGTLPTARRGLPPCPAPAPCPPDPAPEHAPVQAQAPPAPPETGCPRERRADPPHGARRTGPGPYRLPGTPSAPGDGGGGPSSLGRRCASLSAVAGL